MRVGVITRGKYGERLIDTILKHTDFDVVNAAVPELLPGFIEDPDEFLKSIDLNEDVFSADLIVMYTLHPDLTPAIAKMAGERGVKALLIPGGIGRAGSIEELRRISEKYNIYIEVDEICCTLEKVGVDAVDEFAERLGRPEMRVELNSGRIGRVYVIRGSPCGSTWHAARELVGKSAAEAPSLAGLACQQYPCRAVRGTPGGIHTSGDLHKNAMERALGMGSELVLPKQSRPIRIRGGVVETS